MGFIRIWTEVDIKEIKEHIVMVDDLSGYCTECKKIGIDLKEIKKCPSCGIEFKYVTSTESKGGKSDIVKRIKKKIPHLVFVDYNDYERLTGRDKAQSLLRPDYSIRSVFSIIFELIQYFSAGPASV